MKFHNLGSEIYVPDGGPAEQAVARTTHFGIGAHQDDLEIMAYHGILECFGKRDRHFTGVTVTNGAGSPRDDLYASYTDEDMQKVRRVEQRKAAYVGEYSAQVFLDYTSGAVKDKNNPDVVADLKQLLSVAQARVVYTHNLADKHDTHVGVTLRVIQALRSLPASARPEKLYGCEVWRGLDWLNDDDKVLFDVSAHENLAMSLVGIFDSQICGGKRYDLATAGRRRANATYFASHATDVATSVVFGVDLTPLVKDDKLDPVKYITSFIDRFSQEVSARLSKFS
ncbi:MAG: PIG-L family deacetylase [Acidobacteria bacterium]|nr:MAG: PIG-L family deacetylase [Acidobacteriota bacterium]